MEQEYGHYIVSNIMTDDPKLGRKSIFEEEVRSIEERKVQWDKIKRIKANDKLCIVFPSRKYYLEYQHELMRRKKTQNKPVSQNKHETFGDFLEFYSMAKDLYLDDLTDEYWPENERISKNVAKRLSLSVKEVTVGSFDEANDECVYIRFRIQGRKKDIELVNKVLNARYGSDEPDDKK